MNVLVDILGWMGSVFILAAYALNSYQKLRSDSIPFYMLNIAGGILLIVYSVSKEAYANTFINVIWIAVAVPAIVKVIRRTNNTKS